MIDSIFNSAFDHIAPEVRSRYSISNEELLGMVSSEFYKALNNPTITGRKSMLHSLEKEEGQIVFQEDCETPEEMAKREEEEKEQRILAHIERIEKEECRD